MPILPVVFEVSAKDLGLASVSLAATTNSNWIECRGALQLKLDFDIVNVSAVGFVLVYYLDIHDFGEAATVARNEMISVEAAPAGPDVVSALYRRQYNWTSPVAASTYRFFVERPVTFQAFRLSSVTGVAAGAADLISVKASLRYGG
jgi:hypothetical protein